MGILVSLIYIVVCALLIFSFFKYVKNEENFFKILIGNGLAIVLALILFVVFDNLSSFIIDSKSYSLEMTLSFAFLSLYSLMFLGGLTYNIRKDNLKNSEYFPMVSFIITTFLIIFSFYNLILDFRNDVNLGTTNANVIGFKTTIQGDIYPVVSYKVDNLVHDVPVDIPEVDSIKTDDKVRIVYNRKNPDELSRFTYYELVYVPSFIFSIIMLLLILKNIKKDNVD